MLDPLLQERPDVDEALDDRIEGLTKWLEENGNKTVADQAHLDAGSVEQRYWHYGYLIALRDVRDYLAGRKRSLN